MKHFKSQDLLFLANSTFFSIMAFCVLFDWGILGIGPHETVLKYFLYQCIFSFFSLFLYFLYIIATGLEKKHSPESNDTEKTRNKISKQAIIIAVIVFILLFALDAFFITMTYNNRIV